MAAAAAAQGMMWLHLPIVDFQPPDTAFEKAWSAHRDLICALLQSGQNVVAHCRGGRGRSGMIAARLLVEFGLSPDRAIQAVRTVNPLAMETADGFPPGCALIEVHLAELKQIFNSLDPTPFRERDIDPRAEEFIAGWAREIASDKPLGLLIHVDRHDDTAASHVDTVRVAVREFFAERARVARLQLRLLFRRARTSLVIGLLCLAASMVLGNVAENLLADTRFSGIARESLLIGGWVAMWRPLELFLYDWWPIRAEARLFDRLSAMTVRVVPWRAR